MNYRTKLYICFVGLIFFTTTLTVALIYYQNRIFLINELKSKVLSIASTSAALIDVEDIKEIQGPADVEKPAFRDLKNELVLARNINRRKDVYVLHSYLLRPKPANSDKVEFIIDSSTDPKVFALPGQTYEGGYDEGPDKGSELYQHLQEYYVPKGFTTDRFGVYLSAYAPVYDDNGQYVASLGMHVRATDVSEKLRELLIVGFIAFGAGAVLSLLIAHVLSKVITTTLSTLREDVNIIREGDLDHKCSIETEDEFNDLGNAINHMTEGLKEREKIKSNFAKYVSHQVLEKVLTSKEEVHLEGERKEITILFSDIPRFTKVAEGMEPEDTVSLLNEYFEKMLDVILEHNGTIDKFIGEGIMVEFGAPAYDPNQEKNALKAAINMHRVLQELLKKWASKNKPSIDMCIGIHRGFAIVGNMGSEERMEYTAIGDTVNTAARLVDLSKEKNKKILISEEVYQKVQGLCEVEEIGKIRLIGKTLETNVFAVNPFQECKL